MNKSNLKKLSKSPLIDLLLKNQQKPVPKPRIKSKKPVAARRKGVRTKWFKSMRRISFKLQFLNQNC